MQPDIGGGRSHPVLEVGTLGQPGLAQQGHWGCGREQESRSSMNESARRRRGRCRIHIDRKSGFLVLLQYNSRAVIGIVLLTETTPSFTASRGHLGTLFPDKVS